MNGVDELAGLPIGQRVQTIRERQGKSRAVVGGLVGRNEQWLKRVEKGTTSLTWDMLFRLADALGLDRVEKLTGDMGTSLGAIGLSHRIGHDAVPAVREAIEEMPLALTDTPPVDPAELAQRTASAWALWHSSSTPRASVGNVLPQLIRDGRHAARVLDGLSRREAYAALSGAYALSEQLLAWVSDPALLWLAADRCMDAAMQADDPETLAGAAWVLGNVWRATGREDDALELVVDAANLLEPHLNGDSVATRALWGACQLHVGITAARLGREGDALYRLDEANAMAGRLPKAYAHSWTVFGQANTDLTGVTIHVDLHKGGRALDRVNQVDPDSIPSLDRRARLWLETARAYAQKRDYTSTLHVLQRATSISAESMRSHPLARGIAGELVTSGGQLIKTEARGLAKVLGVAV